MFAEESRNGRLNVFYFYVRRLLRIWPLYFVTLLIGFVVYPIVLRLYGIEHHETVRWPMYSIFAANFEHIWNAYPATNILGVQWSVAVEEQFYLLWPIVFILRGRKIFPFILLAVITFSEFFSFKIELAKPAGDYHFLSCVKYLSFGALVSYYCFFEEAAIRKLFGRITKLATVVIYSLFILVICYWHEIKEVFPTSQYLYHIAPTLFTAFVIVEQNYGTNSFFKIGSSKALSWLGRISYGLYLTHMISINIIIGLFPKNESFLFLKMLLSIALCIGLSHLSYYYFESYFLSLKDRFSRLGN